MFADIMYFLANNFELEKRRAMIVSVRLTNCCHVDFQHLNNPRRLIFSLLVAVDLRRPLLHIWFSPAIHIFGSLHKIRRSSPVQSFWRCFSFPFLLHIFGLLLSLHSAIKWLNLKYLNHICWLPTILPILIFVAIICLYADSAGKLVITLYVRRCPFFLSLLVSNITRVSSCEVESSKSLRSVVISYLQILISAY